MHNEIFSVVCCLHCLFQIAICRNTKHKMKSLTARVNPSFINSVQPIMNILLFFLPSDIDLSLPFVCNDHSFHLESFFTFHQLTSVLTMSKQTNLMRFFNRGGGGNGNGNNRTPSRSNSNNFNNSQQRVLTPQEKVCYLIDNPQINDYHDNVCDIM